MINQNKFNKLTHGLIEANEKIKIKMKEDREGKKEKMVR